MTGLISEWTFIPTTASQPLSDYKTGHRPGAVEMENQYAGVDTLERMLREIRAIEAELSGTRGDTRAQLLTVIRANFTDREVRVFGLLLHRVYGETIGNGSSPDDERATELREMCLLVDDVLRWHR